MSYARLLLLNGLRWWKENFWVWGILGSVYSLTLALILQTVVELSLKAEVKLSSVFLGMAIALLVPSLIHALPLPSLPVSFGRPRGSELSSFVRLFLSHELRRSQNWVAVVLTGLVLFSLPSQWLPLALAFGQAPVQQALFSVQKWRALALAHSPQHGARHLYVSFQLLQLVLGGLVLVLWLVLASSAGHSLDLLVRYLPAVFGAWMGGASVMLEGDSGRPWLVNFISLAAGLVAGFFAVLHWGFILLIFYFCVQMMNSVKERLRSVELLDEDTLVP
jgi:hypothetical protein